MTFRTVDEMLARQVAGDARPPAAEHLELRLVQFARGVAVYEMPVRWEVCDPSGAVASGVLTTLAEAAMTAAATTAVPDGHEWSPLAQGLSARFDRLVHADDPGPLRAEAVVMGTDPRGVWVEAEVHCGGARVGSFEATYARGPAAPFRRSAPRRAAGVTEPLAQA